MSSVYFFMLDCVYKFHVFNPKTWWCHQMETFSLSLALCEGNPQVTGGFPSQRPVTCSSDVFFDLPEQMLEQTTKMQVIWDTVVLIIDIMTMETFYVGHDTLLVKEFFFTEMYHTNHIYTYLKLRLHMNFICGLGHHGVLSETELIYNKLDPQNIVQW